MVHKKKNVHIDRKWLNETQKNDLKKLNIDFFGGIIAIVTGIGELIVMQLGIK